MDAKWFRADDSYLVPHIVQLFDELLVMPAHTFFLAYVPPVNSPDESPTYVLTHKCDHDDPAVYICQVYYDEEEPPVEGLDLARDPDDMTKVTTIQGLLLCLGWQGVRPSTEWMRLPYDGTIVHHLDEGVNGAR